VFDADPSFRPVRRRDDYVALEDMGLIGDGTTLRPGTVLSDDAPAGVIAAGVTLARAVDEVGSATGPGFSP
jgi:hypothetical protein